MVVGTAGATRTLPIGARVYGVRLFHQRPSVVVGDHTGCITVININTGISSILHRLNPTALSSPPTLTTRSSSIDHTASFKFEPL